MKLRNAVALIALGLTLVACRSSEPSSAETEKLERRVAELEAALAESLGEEQAGAELAQPVVAHPPPVVPPARTPPTEAVQSAAPPSVVEEPPEPAESDASIGPSGPTAAVEEPEAPAPRELPAPLEIETEPVVPRPDPEPEPLEIPPGTELTLSLETPLSSVDSEPGDLVVAKVERAIDGTGAIALPGATYVEGRVLEVRSSGCVKGRARVVAAFDRIILRGQPRRLETTPIVVEAESGAKRDTKIVAGATAAGAVLGAVLGGKSDAGKGAILGGGAGAGAVLATKGDEVDLPSGSRWTVRVREGGSY